MDALSVRSHFRLAAIFEWLVAAGFLLATVAVGSLILRELRTPPVPRISVTEPARPITGIPPAVPARADCPGDYLP